MIVSSILGLLDVVKTANTLADTTVKDDNTRNAIKSGVNFINNNKDLVKKLAGRAENIASIANKRIHEYPVIISNAFGDNLDTAMNTVKYTEALYAYFLLMSIGMNPVVENGRSITAHIAQFGTESVKADIKLAIIDDEMKHSFEAEMVSGHKPYIMSSDFKEYLSMEASDIMDKIEGRVSTHTEFQEDQTSNEYYRKIKDKSGKDRMEQVFLDASDDTFVDAKGVAIQDSNGQPLTSWNPGDIIKGRYVEINNSPVGTMLKNIDSVGAGLSQRISDNCKVFEKRIGKSLPTTFTVNLIVGDKTIPVNLAVKAVPHFITSDEMSVLFKRCLDGGGLIRKFLRLRSGEFKFFKDFIFNLNQIKDDHKMYAKLERHPWYRALMDRKIKSVVKGIGGLNQRIKENLKDEAILPTVTLLTTVEEISEAINYPYYDAVKTGKIDKIINHLMLLGIFVYDDNRKLLNCHFGGVKNVHIVREKELKQKDKQEEQMDEMIKLFQMMAMKSY